MAWKSPLFLLVAVLVLLLQAPLALAEYTWKTSHCNTNFANHDNWSNGPPSYDAELANNVKTTVFFGPASLSDQWAPVTTYVEASSFAMSELVFAENGMVEFAADGPELVFFASDETNGQTTKFTGGQSDNVECDVNCHKVRVFTLHFTKRKAK